MTAPHAPSAPNALDAPDDAQRTAARVAGFALVAANLIVVAGNFGVVERLVVRGDAAATARRILANETLYRLSLAGDLVYCALGASLVAALYVLLRPAGRHLALAAALWRMLFVVMWGYMALRGLEALRFLDPPSFVRVLDTARLEELARLHISARFDGYYGGLLFFALGDTAVALLLLRTRFVPRWLAMFGLVSCAWCVVCALAYIVWPGFGRVVNPWLFDSGLGLFELAAGAWLLARGLPRAAARGPATTAVPDLALGARA